MVGLGRKKDGVLLLGIVLASLALRLATYKYEYLLGIDPFHHYRIAEYLAEKGELPVIWPLSLAPTGAAITEPAGLYYLSVLLHRLLEPLGLSFLQTFKLAPALFGAFTIVPVYLLARGIFDRRVALFSSLVLAFLPASIYRSFAGFYRGDVFSVFFMLWGFYLFLASLDGPRKRRVATSALAGLSLGLMGLVWNGFLFGFGVLTLSFLFIVSFSYYRGSWSWGPLQSYLISAGLGVGLIWYSVYLRPSTSAPAGALVAICLGAGGFSAALGFTDLTLRDRGVRARVAVAGLLVLASASLLQAAYPGLLGSLLSGYGALGQDDPVLGRVSELQRPTLASLWEKYSLLEVLGPSEDLILFSSAFWWIKYILAIMGFSYIFLGFYYTIKEFYHDKSVEKIFLVVWTLASILLLAKAVRFSFLASFPLGFLGGLGISKVRIPRPKEARRLAPPVMLLCLAFTGASFATEWTPDMDKEWGEALTFLKGQGPGVVLSWWNAGSWVQGVTGFPTIVDSVHGQNRSRIGAVAGLLLENDTAQVRDFLGRYGVRYIVVSSDLIYHMGDIQAAVNTSGYNYSILYPSGTGTIEGKMAAIYGKEKNFLVFRDEGGIQVLYLEGGKAYRLERVHYREEQGLVTRRNEPPPPILEGSVYATKDFVIYASPRLEGTLLNSLVLLDGEGFTGLQQIYSNPRVRIYEVVPQ